MITNTLQKNIPNGWQEKKLGDVCNIVNGSTPKRSVSEYWENGNIPWFTVNDIRSNGRIINKTNQNITDKALKETSVKLLPEDSVLLCCTASLGEVALTKIPLTTNQQFNGLVSRDKKTLFPYYLFYSAQKLGENLKSKSGKTTINFLSVGSLSKEKILLPPLKEQQKITEILGTVDEDIAKTQEVIEATEKLKRGLMQQLFTRGIQNAEFKVLKLGDLCIFKTGKLNSNRAVDGGTYPFFTCSQETFAIDQYSFDQKAILLAGNNAAGKYSVKYYDGKFNAYQRTYVISIKNENHLSYPYLKEVLNTRLNELRDSSVGSTTKFLTLKLLENLPISLPPISEQREIAEILASINEKISVNKKLKAKLTLLKKGLMQDLLSGKVRVSENLVVETVQIYIEKVLSGSNITEIMKDSYYNLDGKKEISQILERACGITKLDIDKLVKRLDFKKNDSTIEALEAFLAELRSIFWLQDLGFTDIEPLQAHKNIPQPDFTAKFKNNTFAIEVFCLTQAHEQQKDSSLGVYKNFDPQFTGSKFGRDFMSKAADKKKQLDSSNATKKILLCVINSDPIIRLNSSQEMQNYAKFFHDQLNWGNGYYVGILTGVAQNGIPSDTIYPKIDL